MDYKTSPRRRAYSTNQIADYNPAKRVYTPSDPNSVAAKNPLRRTKVQELIGQMSPEHEAQWRNDYQVTAFETELDHQPLLFVFTTYPDENSLYIEITGRIMEIDTAFHFEQ